MLYPFHRSSFSPLIPWEKLSAGSMQRVHDLRLLHQDRENEVLLKMLWAREGDRQQRAEKSGEDGDKSRLLDSRLSLKIKSRFFDKRGVSVNCALVKVCRSSAGPTYNGRGQMQLVDNYFDLDPRARQDFLRLDKDGGGQAFSVDADDLRITFSSQVRLRKGCSFAKLHWLSCVKGPCSEQPPTFEILNSAGLQMFQHGRCWCRGAHGAEVPRHGPGDQGLLPKV